MKARNNSTFMEASLSDSVLYNSFNGNAELNTKIIVAIKNSMVIDDSYIQEQILQIKRTRISPLAENVLKAREDGNIVLLYSKNGLVPQILPFFATKINGKIKVFIFLNNYGTIPKSEVDTSSKYLNITMKDLYVLMEGAYVAYKYALYPMGVTKTLGLMKVSCNIYSSMIMRILNRDFSVGNDKELYQRVMFTLGLFFNKRVWMSTNDDISFSYACECCKVGSEAINKALMYSILEEFNSKNILNIEDVLNYIKTFSPRFKSLNFRYFVQCYANMYKQSAIFSLECLPYFLYTIEASMIGSFIVGQPIISDITKNTKGMNTFYPELVKAIN